MTPLHQLFFGSTTSWLGHGRLSFTISSEELPFYSRWTILKKTEKEIVWTQEIEVQDLEEVMVNEGKIYNITPSSFAIDLTNDLWGTVSGTGVIDEKVISWEFMNDPENFHGYEIYEKKEGQEDGYLLKAEYLSPDSYRTHVQGELWIATTAQQPDESTTTP